MRGTWRTAVALLVMISLALMLVPAVATATSHTFTITAPAPNATLVAGSTVNIQWSGGNPSWNVYISLIDVQAWAFAALVTPSTPNTGSYTYTLPPALPPGIYEVYIQEVGGLTWSYSASFEVVKEKPESNLVIEKRAAGELQAGQNGTYHLAVSNTGTGPAAGPITVTDVLGAGLTYVSATGSGWTCSASGQTVTCVHPGPLPANSSLPAITLTVAVGTGVDQVENCAAVGDSRTCVKTPVVVVKTGSICGVKFEDLDGDGVQDPGEPGLPGWTIQLTDAAGTVIATVVTGADGQYCFKGLQPGSYTVSEVSQPFWSQTYPASGTHSVGIKDILHIKDVSFGNVYKGELGAVCGVKFHDINSNGIQDPGEPGLSGWTIQVRDAAGNLIATTVSGDGGRFCFEKLKPGTYTFSEVLQPGWNRTYPTGAGTHTVTLTGGTSGQGIAFGNVKRPEPCCLTFKFPAGASDNFSSAGTEVATPRPQLATFLAGYGSGNPGTAFDSGTSDRFFAHSFTLPTGNCLKSAKLEIKARPQPGNSLARNDTISLQFYGVTGSPSWTSYFGSGNASPGLLPSQWNSSNYPSGSTFTIDLGSLPGGGSVLPWVNSQRFVDVVVQDDTSIDYMVLVVEFCECRRFTDITHISLEEAHAMSRTGTVAPGPTEETAPAPAPAPSPTPVPGTQKVLRLVVGSTDATVDGEPRRMSVPPINEGGSVLVPLRWIGEALGARVGYDSAEQKVTYVLGDRTVELWIGRTTALVNGQPVTLPVAPLLRQSSTYVPVRFVSEALGAGVTYDPADRSVTITYPK